MRGAVERWYVYGHLGSVGWFTFFNGRTFENATICKHILEKSNPDEGPYFLVVEFISKATGKLVAGCLDDSQPNRIQDEAS